MKFLFRTDSSKQIGTGHVMRCLNFAQRLKQYGHEVRFVCRNLKLNIFDKIKNNGFEVFVLDSDLLNSENTTNVFHNNWLETSWENDAKQTIEILKYYQADWLVVDHYALDFNWENNIKSNTSSKIFVIDDLADRNHFCDVILDHNFSLNHDIKYANLIPSSCESYLGPEYSLISENFWITEKANPLGNNIFVFFGGIDSIGATLKVLDLLCNSDYIDYNVKVVCGSNNIRIKDITVLCNKNNFELFVDTDQIAEIISSCSLGIGGGG